MGRILAVEGNHEALTAGEGHPHPAGGVGEENIVQPAATGLAVEHLADAPERSLTEVVEACARKGTSLKIRTGLSLWNPEVKPYGAFRGWRGQSWILTLKGVQEARRLQQVIELVFDLIRLGGMETTWAQLNGIKRGFDHQK